VNPRVTILDVAARAGVSISSVSAALNDRPGVSEETRRRIVEAAEHLGWVPSLRGRSLSGQKAYAVGLVLERSPEVIESDPFFAGFIAGVESVLEQQGYALVLQLASNRVSAVQRYRQLALDHRVDGVFLTDLARNDARVRLVTELGLPAVAVNSSPRCALPSVRQDHVPGLRELLEEVVALGHRRIAHVAGRKGLIHTRQRVEAWRAALAAAGLEEGPIVYGDFTVESGSRAADAVLDAAGPRPTAVVCANDLMAIGFIARVSARGVEVPMEMSVTGFDGIKLGAFVRPALTSVATSPRLLGESAAATLMSVIRGDSPPDVSVPATSLLWRDSLVQVPRV
jgi:DNA-binding LacI/PurR family transcriptional regulator